MVRIYKEGIQAMIKSGLKLENIGFLYLVLHCVDYSSCTIVNDPFAEFPVPLTYQEIGEKLGLTRSTLNKYLTMCFEYSFGKDERRDKYLLKVFGKFDGGKKAYCINPIILRRCATLKGVIEYNQLEEIFKITGKIIR